MPRERLRLPQQREKARWYPPNGQRLCSTHTSRVKVPADLGAPALFLVHFAAGWTAPSAWCPHGRQQTSVTKLIYRKQIRPRVGRGRGYCDGPARQQPQRGTVVTQIVTQTINGQLRGCPELAADLVVLWSG